MKPAFALDFRDATVRLLHRTGAGWHEVGQVNLEAPDLPEALGYLRATALGLSPRGISAKLVIPNDQILFTTVHAPGPDAAALKAKAEAEAASKAKAEADAKVKAQQAFGCVECAIPLAQLFCQDGVVGVVLT